MLSTTLLRYYIVIIERIAYYCLYYAVINYVTTILHCHHQLTTQGRNLENDPLDIISSLYNWSFTSFRFPFHQQENCCIATCVYGSRRCSSSKEFFILLHHHESNHTYIVDVTSLKVKRTNINFVQYGTCTTQR